MYVNCKNFLLEGFLKWGSQLGCVLLALILLPVFVSFSFATEKSTRLVREPIETIPFPDSSIINTDEVQLGKQLFHDVRLSKGNSIACSSCHNISKGGDDGLKQSKGVDGELGTINAPTVVNSVFNIAQFWDGRAKTLEEQAEGPIHNPVEMGSTWLEITLKLSEDKDMVSVFSQLYSDGLTPKNIVRAIVAYEKQLIAYNSPFDQYLRGNDNAISVEAKQGYKVFKRKGCISCHQGKNVGGNMYQTFGTVGNYFEDRGDLTDQDLGRFNLTGKEVDRYSFKVPSLRNVVDTAPYFHDGSEPSLEGAIRKMAQYQLGRPLTDIDITNIIAFLESLNGVVEEDLL